MRLGGECLMFYDQILDKDERLAYSLIELFINKGMETIQLTEIREELHVSTHRLFHLLKIIEDLAERFKTFSILISKKECTLKSSPTFSLQDIYMEMFKTSIGFKLLSELLSKSTFSLENFAQKNFMSTRTIYRKIPILHDYLNNYHMELNLRKKYPLSGDEYFIRYFFHILYWQIYGPSRKYDQLTNKQISEIERSLSEKYPYFRKIDRSRWIHYFDLTLKRVRNGFYLKKIPNEIKNFRNICIKFETFKEQILVYSFFPNKIDEKTKECEARLLYYVLSMMTTYSFTESKALLAKSPEKTNKVNYSIQTFIVVIEKLFHIKLTDAEVLFLKLNLLVIHSKTHVYATKSKTDVFGRETSETGLADFFPAYYYKIKDNLLNSNCQETFLKLYQKNERLFFQYCILLREILENHQSIPFRIFLQSKFGKLQEEWQKRRLKDIVSNDICIQFVDDEQKANLILTDYTNQNDELKEEKYYWQTNPTGKDWKHIVNYITNYKRKYLN